MGKSIELLFGNKKTIAKIEGEEFDLGKPISYQVIYSNSATDIKLNQERASSPLRIKINPRKVRKVPYLELKYNMVDENIGLNNLRVEKFVEYIGSEAEWNLESLRGHPRLLRAPRFEIPPEYKLKISFEESK